MGQHYSDPARESDPHALPDVEVFYEDDPPHECCVENMKYGRPPCCVAGDGPGWYWWSCFPGCMPNGDAYGPFETEALAIADAREE